MNNNCRFGDKNIEKRSESQSLVPATLESGKLVGGTSESSLTLSERSPPPESLGWAVSYARFV